MTLRLTPRPRGRAPRGMSWDPTRGQWVPEATPVGTKRSRGSAASAKTAKRRRLSGEEFGELAGRTMNNPNSTIIQLMKLREEAGGRGNRALENRLRKEIQRRRGGTKRKMTPSPVAATASKRPRTIRDIKSAARKQMAAARDVGTARTLARRALTNEQFRNQITKILDTQKLSRANLTKLKNNANERNGMNAISNRINRLLNPRSPRGRPRSASVANRAYNVAAAKMVGAIKTAYLAAVKRRIETVSIRNNRKPAKLYFLYDTFRIVSASVIHRRWVRLYGMPTTIDENKIEEDLDKNFIPVYEDKTKVARLKNISETQQTVINFNQQQLFRWFFLMWLDSHHDGTTSATSSFFRYLDFINVNRDIQKAIRSYDYENDVLLTSGSFGNISPKNNRDITPPTKGRFEAIMKTQLFRFFKQSNNVVSVRRQSEIRGGKLSVALDQENAASISLFISGNHNNAVNKVTVANFMDPGVYMQNGIGLNDDFDKFFVSRSNSAEMFKRLNNDYIVNTFSFSLRYESRPFMELRTFLNSHNNLDPANYEKSRPIKLEFRYLMNNNVMSGWKDVTPYRRERNTTFEGVMNKYFGDCLQGLVVATNNKFRPDNPIHVATGDGAFAGVFGNICDAINVPTRLVLDNAIAEGILDIYNLPDDIVITGLINKPDASGNVASSRMA